MIKGREEFIFFTTRTETIKKTELMADGGSDLREFLVDGECRKDPPKYIGSRLATLETNVCSRVELFRRQREE